MKKITRIFALALAFVMAFALQAPVNAAEKAAVNQEKAQATVQAGSFTHRVRSLYYNSSTKKASLTIEVNSSGVYRYQVQFCLLYTSPSPRDRQKSRMPSSA